MPDVTWLEAASGRAVGVGTHPAPAPLPVRRQRLLPDGAGRAPRCCAGPSASSCRKHRHAFLCESKGKRGDSKKAASVRALLSCRLYLLVLFLRRERQREQKLPGSY